MVCWKRIVAIISLGFLLLIPGSVTTNAEKGEEQYGDTNISYEMASTVGNHFHVRNLGMGLSGDIFMPFIVRPIIPGTFLGKIVFSSYSPDTIFNEIFVMNADGSNMTPLVQELIDNFRPQWSPDGSSIAFTKYRKYTDSQIYKMDADGTNQVDLTNSNSYNDYPAWSPDGSKIAFVSVRAPEYDNNLYVMNSDGSNPVQLTFYVYYQVRYPTWASDGSKIAFIAEYNDIERFVVMNTDGSNPVEIHSSSDFDFVCLDWSLDGTKLIFSAREVGDPFNPSQIYTINPDGSGLNQLTTEYSNVCPTWSGDGTQIAFTSTRDGGQFTDMFAMNVDGSDPQNLTHSQQFEREPSWSN